MRIYKGEVPPTNGVAIAQDAGTSEGVKKSWLKRERAKEDADLDSADKGKKRPPNWGKGSNMGDDGERDRLASMSMDKRKELYDKLTSNIAKMEKKGDHLPSILRQSLIDARRQARLIEEIEESNKGDSPFYETDAKIAGLVAEYKKLDNWGVHWSNQERNAELERKAKLRRLLSTLRCFTPTGKVKSPREKRHELVKVADDVIMQFADKGIDCHRYTTKPSNYNDTDNKFFVPHGTSFEGIKIGEQYAACILDQSGSFGDLIAIAHRVKA